MIEKKKAKGIWILKVLLVLFILFLSLNIAMSAGYYEARLSEKTQITKEAMQRFERDIKEGKEVDIKDYLETDTNDYSNQMTKAGVAISGVMQDFMSKGINQMIEILKKLFT